MSRAVLADTGQLYAAVSPDDLVNPVAEDFRAARERLVSYADQPLSLFDTVLAVLSSRLGLPVWTFNHHFDLLRVEVWRPGA